MWILRHLERAPIDDRVKIRQLTTYNILKKFISIWWVLMDMFIYYCRSKQLDI